MVDSAKISSQSCVGGIKKVLVRDTRDHLAGTAENGDPMHKVCIRHNLYPSQDTSRMGTARVKQEEEADTRIIAKDE